MTMARGYEWKNAALDLQLMKQISQLLDLKCPRCRIYAFVPFNGVSKIES